MTASAAFGAAGNATLGVAANAPVSGHITLLDFSNPKNSWELSDDEKLQRQEQLKNDGNGFFKAGDFVKAKRRFARKN